MYGAYQAHGPPTRQVSVAPVERCRYRFGGVAAAVGPGRQDPTAFRIGTPVDVAMKIGQPDLADEAAGLSRSAHRPEAGSRGSTIIRRSAAGASSASSRVAGLPADVAHDLRITPQCAKLSSKSARTCGRRISRGVSTTMAPPELMVILDGRGIVQIAQVALAQHGQAVVDQLGLHLVARYGVARPPARLSQTYSIFISPPFCIGAVVLVVLERAQRRGKIRQHIRQLGSHPDPRP